MALTDKKLSVVVACYRDAGTIHALYGRLRAVLERITSRFEILYVNDASPDNALDILRPLAERDPHLVVITHSRNFGSQAAFTSGMEIATGDAIVLMDGDLQDPPELIEPFVTRWLAGADVVFGERTRRKASLFRRIAYKVFYRVFRRLSYVNVPLDAGDFALMDRRVAQELSAMPERDRFLRGLRAWVGFHQVSVPYTREQRFSGTTTNSLFDNLRWAKKGIVSLSYAPLEAISYLAFAVVCVALLALGAYVVAYFYFGAPPGFPTLVVIILFLGALQLLSLSVIAEYLGCIFQEVKQRPKFLVREILNDPRPRT